MLDTLTKIIKDHWGDIASVTGVVVSVVGFILTIAGVLRSKNAAQRAEQAVREVKGAIVKVDTMVELSAAITMMDEIKRLHRASAWSILPDRYSSLKRLLITIRGSNSSLSDEHRDVILGAIQHFSDMEKKVERSLSAQQSPPNAAKLNEIVSLQLDRLGDVLASIRQQIGVENHGGE